MSVTGAHYDLRPGAMDAMIINWVYDPRRVSPNRQGAFAGPSIEDASVITVNAGIVYDPTPSGPPPIAICPDVYMKVAWSSGGKDDQSVEFDLTRGSSVSFPAARATVSASYAVYSFGREGERVLLQPNDPILGFLPKARVEVTLGRLPAGRRPAHRTVLYGPVGPGDASNAYEVPNFSESLIVHGTVVPLVCRVRQIISGPPLAVSEQNVTSSKVTDIVPVHGSAGFVELENLSATDANFYSVQYLLSL